VQKLLKEDEAAELLNVSAEALKRMRLRGDGPVSVRIGTKLIRYRPEDLLAYLESQGGSN
jgi:predicted DNA-binding transcriptional regulator AlpA